MNSLRLENRFEDDSLGIGWSQIKRPHRHRFGIVGYLLSAIVGFLVAGIILHFVFGLEYRDGKFIRSQSITIVQP